MCNMCLLFKIAISLPDFHSGNYDRHHIIESVIMYRMLLWKYVVMWFVRVRSQYNIECIGVVVIELWCL
jgi:hypothetical protein